MEDVTTEWKLLWKEAKLEILNLLAGGVAHDFNNILSGLFGNIYSAKDNLSTEHPVSGFLEQAEKSISRASSFSGQLLNMSRGGEPLKDDVNLSFLVEETV